MRHGVTHSIFFQNQLPTGYSATSSQDKIEEIFRQFPSRGTATLHTHTRLYKAVHYRKKSILTMGNLQNKSSNNLCGVADWLSISGLNAILPCASSWDSYTNSTVAR